METIEINENQPDFKEQLRVIYQLAIKEIVEKNLNLKSDEYEIIYSAGSSKGDNFLGIVFRVQIKDKKDDSIKMSLIAKVPPENVARREEFMIHHCFVRESLFYDEILSLYKQFQIEKKIDVDKEGFYEAPKCFKTMSEDTQEGIFIEDLKVRNFHMIDKKKDVKREHVLLGMRSIAKMHALFFALKDQNPKLVESFRDIEDSWIVFTKSEKSLLPYWFQSQIGAAIGVAEKIKDEKMKRRVSEVLNKGLVQLLNETVRKGIAEPYSTLCHGDCRNNNMMFKNDESGTPIDICLLDFQIIRNASPVCDLLYYIFLCTTKELRDKHYQEFLDVYYETLSNFIKRLGSNPEKLYPRRILDEHLRKFGQFGILVAILMIPMLTSEAEQTPDINNISEQMHNQVENIEVKFITTETVSIYESRMMEIYTDMYDLGYI